MFEYRPVSEVIKHKGLRLVVLKDMPSPWGQAAKAILDLKGLDYVAAPLLLGSDNKEIVAWSGQNSAPVVALGDEKPVHRWVDILMLAERLAPEPELVPTDAYDRVLVFGFSHEICGELGIGWNRRLQFIADAVDAGARVGVTETLIAKYGFNKDDAKTAGTRVARSITALAKQLRAQQQRGVDYFVGDALSAVDIYWTAFMNFLAPLSYEHCPVSAQVRAGFTATDPQIIAALDPILVEHRDRIFKAYFRDPMEF